MTISLESNLTACQRRKLSKARENGYLDGRGAGIGNLLIVFSLWCWRLRLPLVWFERLSPRSRYGRVRLDLYTTANRLTGSGQAELQGLIPGALDISPHDALWRRIPLRKLETLAARVIRAAVKPGNTESAVPRFIQVEPREPAELIEFPRPRSASA